MATPAASGSGGGGGNDDDPIVVERFGRTYLKDEIKIFNDTSMKKTLDGKTNRKEGTRKHSDKLQHKDGAHIRSFCVVDAIMEKYPIKLSTGQAKVFKGSLNEDDSVRTKYRTGNYGYSAGTGRGPHTKQNDDALDQLLIKVIKDPTAENLAKLQKNPKAVRRLERFVDITLASKGIDPPEFIDAVKDIGSKVRSADGKQICRRNAKESDEYYKNLPADKKEFVDKNNKPLPPVVKAKAMAKHNGGSGSGSGSNSSSSSSSGSSSVVKRAAAEVKEIARATAQTKSVTVAINTDTAAKRNAVSKMTTELSKMKVTNDNVVRVRQVEAAARQQERQEQQRRSNEADARANQENRNRHERKDDYERNTDRQREYQQQQQEQRWQQQHWYDQLRWQQEHRPPRQPRQPVVNPRGPNGPDVHSELSQYGGRINNNGTLDGRFKVHRGKK